MKISDFESGDKIRITFRMSKTVVSDAEVRSVNWNNNGLVTFYGKIRSGYFDPNVVGTQPFGITKVEMVKPVGRYEGSEPYGV